jgi:hypothetical protein
MTNSRYLFVSDPGADMSDTIESTHDRHTSATLRPRASAPRLARRLVRDLARGSGLPDRVVDDAAFVLGELVTTSLRQVGGPTTVVIVLDATGITVRVHDDGSDETVREDHSTGAARRWDVVKRLASSWGYSGDGGRRELWATIRTERGLVAA